MSFEHLIALATLLVFIIQALARSARREPGAPRRSEDGPRPAPRGARTPRSRPAATEARAPQPHLATIPGARRTTPPPSRREGEAAATPPRSRSAERASDRLRPLAPTSAARSRDVLPRDVAGLRRAFVMSTVLGRPLALRRAPGPAGGEDV